MLLGIFALFTIAKAVCVTRFFVRETSTVQFQAGRLLTFTSKLHLTARHHRPVFRKGREARPAVGIRHMSGTCFRSIQKTVSVGRRMRHFTCFRWIYHGGLHIPISPEEVLIAANRDESMKCSVPGSSTNVQISIFCRLRFSTGRTGPSRMLCLWLCHMFVDRGRLHRGRL